MEEGLCAENRLWTEDCRFCLWSHQQLPILSIVNWTLPFLASPCQSSTGHYPSQLPRPPPPVLISSVSDPFHLSYSATLSSSWEGSHGEGHKAVDRTCSWDWVIKEWLDVVVRCWNALRVWKNIHVNSNFMNTLIVSRWWKTKNMLCEFLLLNNQEQNR